MRGFYAVIVLTVGISLFWGCAEDETPMAPVSDPPEFVATITIDSCEGFAPGEPLYDLCGGSSDIRASFEFIVDDIKETSTYGKSVTFRTGPGTWEFSRHGCERHCRLSNVLHDLFEGRPLWITASRVTSPAGSEIHLRMDLVAGTPAEAYDLWFSINPAEMSVDEAGFPTIDGDLAFSGDLRIGRSDRATVFGSADVTVKNWQSLPVHHKPEPPVVTRPTFTVQDLRDAPETLELGEYTLAFRNGDATRPAIDRGITVSFSIWEQGLWDFDQGRLDFLWVVHESGEVWEPEIQSAWDYFRMDRSASDGPEWGAGTDVDIVAGFVDLNGDVWVMRTTDTIESSF